METADGKTIYPTFEDAAYEWLRLWSKEGCDPISKALGSAEGTTRALFLAKVNDAAGALGGGCFDQAMAVIASMDDMIKDVPEQIETTRAQMPDGCVKCGNNEITIQETRTFTVILDPVSSMDTMIEETNPGCNTTTYSCTKCGHQEIEG